VTWREGVRCAPRLQPFDFSVPLPVAANLLQKTAANGTLQLPSLNGHSKSYLSFSAEVNGNNVLLQEAPRFSPKGSEVEIHVQYIGLTRYHSKFVSLVFKFLMFFVTFFMLFLF